MRRWVPAVLVLLVLLVVAAVLWFNCTGTFSHVNFERIRPGMSLAEAERILGSPGVEIHESELPHIVDWSVPVEDPKRIRPVVAGEKYVRWELHDSKIIVSLRGGVVAEKWYWEPSL